MKFAIYEIGTNHRIYDDIYLQEDGTLQLIEERSVSYQTYMYKKDVSDKYYFVILDGDEQ